MAEPATDDLGTAAAAADVEDVEDVEDAGDSDATESKEKIVVEDTDSDDEDDEDDGNYVDQDYDEESGDEDDYEYQENEMYGRRFQNRKTSMQTYIKNRPRTSKLVQEALNIDTQDLQDHTFNGIMFDVRAANHKPLEFLLVESVWVRGALGPVSVYVTKEAESFRTHRTNPEAWRRVYSGTHERDFENYTELKLAEPFKVLAGQTHGLYVHSERERDDGIVYDNASSRQDADVNTQLQHGTLVVEPRGCAHLCPQPFESRNPWGWGSGWRQDREFVGRISYGVRWMLWNPECDAKFPPSFREISFAFVAAGYRPNSIVSMLPQEMVLYILNFCDWNFFGDNMKVPEPAPARRVVEPTGRPRQFFLNDQQLRDLVLQMQAAAHADDE